MTDPCREVEALLYERAAGAIAPAAEALLETHLGGCARCRREAAHLQEALALARMPPPPDASGDELARATLAAWHRRRRTRRRLSTAALVGLGAAAAASIALAVAPALLGARAGGGRPPAAPELSRSWEPDVDGAWQASAFLEDSSDDLATDDALLEAYDVPLG